MLKPIEYWKNTLARLGVRVERRRVRRSLTGVRAGIETLERRQVMSIDSPLIAGFSVSPEIVSYGSQVTLAATGVTDPGGAAIAQVRFHIDADNNGQLSSADGAPLAVDADGSNGWSAVVSSLLSQGGNQRYFAVAQNDSGVNGDAVSATNTVLLPAKIIDNSSSSGYATVSSQYWSTSSGGYSGGHQFEFGATGGYAEWTFANLPAGEYRVFATWAEGTNRGTNVPYSVSDGSLNLATVKVNQRVMPTADVVASSKNFQNLGAFSVVNGSIVVRMTNSSGDGRAIADAVRIQHIGPAQQTSEIRVFDGSTELTDTVSTANLGSTFYGTPSATKTLTVKNVGLSDLVLTPLTQPNMPAGVTLVSSYATTTLARGASTTFQVRLSATNPGAVTGNLSVASNDSDEGSFDIAISGVVNGVKIIDNTSAAGYSTVSSGYWSTSSVGYSGGHQFEFGATGGYAEWTFANLPAGEYRVSATWAEGTNRGTNVPYTIFDGSYSLGAVPVNQRIAPVADVLVSGTKFQNLGSFSAINSSLVVRITNSSGDGRAIADAIRIEHLGPAQQAPEIRVFDGSTELYDNSSTVNLGTTFFGTPTTAKTLTVTNSGTTGLILSPLTQANMPAGITLVSSYGSSTLAPGASTSFQVRLSAMSTGAVSGVLSLSSNDPSESSFHITLTGVVDAAKIIDNGDVGYSTVSSNYWSTTAGYQFEFGATGGYAEWSFPNLPAGEYRISAAWPNDPAWSSIAPYSILDGGVSLDTIRVNQQLAPDSDVVTGGKKFQDLGLVGITNGSLAVRLTHEGPNRVVADAIRVQYVGTLPEVQFSDTGSQFKIDGATATVLDFGQSERSQKAVEVIAVTNQTSSALSLTQVTQADLPAGYLLLSGFGASTLAPGESAYARIRLDAIAPGIYGGTVPILAGAESFDLAITGEVIKTPVLVDNGDPGFSTTGTGWQNGTAGEGFQDDHLKTSGAASGKAATWTVEGLAAGAYLVYAAYLPSTDKTAAAQYNLYDGTQAGGVLEQQGTVNQRLTPDDVVVSGKGFGYVGQINVSSSTLTVELDASNPGGGLALADAIYVVPATLGTYFGFSSPGNMVTGSAESITTGFVDPDGELVDALNLYRDSNNNGVLDVDVDQLLHSDATPGDGLNFDASTLASGAYRLFVAAMGDDGVVASTMANVTASEWWKVAITQSRTHGEAEFSTTGDLTADPTPIKLASGLTWIDAVYSRVYGQVTTYNSWEGQYYYYTFPYRPTLGVPNEIDGAFDVDIQSAIQAEHAGHNPAKAGDTRMIVLEDLTRAARNDKDYDDQYWVVTATAILNEAPVITSDGGGSWASVHVPENQAAVTTVTATDEDVPVQTLTYSITGGADRSLFTIMPSTGVLSFIVAPDHENPTDAGADNTYDVQVTVTDSGTPNLADVQDVAVTVTEVNEAPVITSDGGGTSASIEVFENQAAVTTVVATDPDRPAQMLTCSITGGADQALFSIDAATGALAFIAPPNYEEPQDVEAYGVYLVEVTVTDSGSPGLSDVQDILVIVRDVNEAPVVKSPGDQEHKEGTLIAFWIDATDEDGDGLTYSADNLPAGLTIEAATGFISGKIAYTAAGVYSATVTVSDSDFAVTVAFSWEVLDTWIDFVLGTEVFMGTPIANQVRSDGLAAPEIFVMPGNRVSLTAASALNLPDDMSDVLFAVPGGVAGDFSTAPMIVPLVGVATPVRVGIDINQNGLLDDDEVTHRLVIQRIVLNGPVTFTSRRSAGDYAEDFAFPIRQGENFEVGGTFEFTMVPGVGSNIGPSPMVRYKLISVSDLSTVQTGSGLSFTHTFSTSTTGFFRIYVFLDRDGTGDGTGVAEDFYYSEDFWVQEAQLYEFGVWYPSATAAGYEFTDYPHLNENPSEGIAEDLAAGEKELMRRTSIDDWRALVDFRLDPARSYDNAHEFEASEAMPTSLTDEASQANLLFDAAPDWTIIAVVSWTWPTLFYGDMTTLGRAELVGLYGWGDEIVLNVPGRNINTLAHEIGHIATITHHGGDDDLMRAQPELGAWIINENDARKYSGIQ